MVAFRNSDAGNFEIIDTVPGGQGDVNEEDLKKVETASFASKLHIVSHLQLDSDGSKSDHPLYQKSFHQRWLNLFITTVTV